MATLQSKVGSKPSGEHDIVSLLDPFFSHITHSILLGRHAVLDRGISLLDTAPWYGHGTSEKVVGFALDTMLSEDSNRHSERENAYSDYYNIPHRRRTGFLPRSCLIINTKVGRYESDPMKQFDFSYR
jgi:hypothetical protein